MRLLLAIATALVLLAPAPSVAGMTVGETTRLIRLAEKNVEDANGWAIDLLDVLELHELGVSRENVCAAIAVIDQESGFVADPAIPDLGKLAEAALREKIGKYPVAGKAMLSWLERSPSPEASFMARIRAARSERDLDLAYRSLVDYLGRNTSLNLVIELGFLNRLIEERNEIDTAGSMQVSVKFALDEAQKRRWLPATLSDVYAVRDQLYTRHGGMFYGIKQLMGYETGYSRKVYRFADYNAGRHASRNAAFQRAVASLLGSGLALDGDLLSYGKDGKPLKMTTSTERAVQRVSVRHKLGLTQTQIRSDLLSEKEPGFSATRTYLSVRDRFAAVFGKAPPFAVLPDISLSGPKLSRGFTTRQFAERVDKRYQACMASRL